MVMGDDSCPRGRGSNPSTIYWMDIFYIDLLLKLYCLFEKTIINKKRPMLAHY